MCFKILFTIGLNNIHICFPILSFQQEGMQWPFLCLIDERQIFRCKDFESNEVCYVQR